MPLFPLLPWRCLSDSLLVPLALTSWVFLRSREETPSSSRPETAPHTVSEPKSRPPVKIWGSKCRWQPGALPRRSVPAAASVMQHEPTPSLSLVMNCRCSQRDPQRGHMPSLLVKFSTFNLFSSWNLCQHLATIILCFQASFHSETGTGLCFVDGDTPVFHSS